MNFRSYTFNDGRTFCTVIGKIGVRVTQQQPNLGRGQTRSESLKKNDRVFELERKFQAWTAISQKKDAGFPYHVSFT